MFSPQGKQCSNYIVGVTQCTNIVPLSELLKDFRVCQECVDRTRDAKRPKLKTERCSQIHVVGRYNTEWCKNCVPFASQLKGSNSCKSCEKIGFCDFIKSDGSVCGNFKHRDHIHCGVDCGNNCECMEDYGSRWW
jgi:hypothetical protein